MAMTHSDLYASCLDCSTIVCMTPNTINDAPRWCSKGRDEPFHTCVLVGWMCGFFEVDHVDWHMIKFCFVLLLWSPVGARGMEDWEVHDNKDIEHMFGIIVVYNSCNLVLNFFCEVLQHTWFKDPPTKSPRFVRPFNPCHLTLTPTVWWKVIHSTFTKAPKYHYHINFLAHQIQPVAIKYFTLLNILNEWKIGRQHFPLTPYNSSSFPITYVRRSFLGPHLESQRPHSHHCCSSHWHPPTLYGQIQSLQPNISVTCAPKPTY